eukprot:g2829.t1
MFRTVFHTSAKFLPRQALSKQLSRRALSSQYHFSESNVSNPELTGLEELEVIDVPLVEATDESLKGYGKLVNSPDELTVENGNFEIVQWPQPGWRKLDPGTGDEAGTTEGNFRLRWDGDFFRGENLAIATTNNSYLNGLGAEPKDAKVEAQGASGDGSAIYLWMSDYHPDGGQLFFPKEKIPFVACLGKSTYGDDIQPENMVAFHVPAGKGIYFDPSTWHNGVYVEKKYAPSDKPATFLTRQGRVHARVSVSWSHEFNKILRVPLSM